MVKNLPSNTGDMSSIPGLGRSPGEGNGNPLRYSGLGNSMDKGAWQATVHGVETAGHDLVIKPPPPNLIIRLPVLQKVEHCVKCA